jgi:hypothetical protein
MTSPGRSVPVEDALRFQDEGMLNVDPDEVAAFLETSDQLPHSTGSTSCSAALRTLQFRKRH